MRIQNSAVTAAGRARSDGAALRRWGSRASNSPARGTCSHVAPELGAVLAGAVDQVQLPLHFHTFPTTPPRARQEAPQIRRAAMFTGLSAFQMGLIHIIAGSSG